MHAAMTRMVITKLVKPNAYDNKIGITISSAFFYTYLFELKRALEREECHSAVSANIDRRSYAVE